MHPDRAYELFEQSRDRACEALDKEAALDHQFQGLDVATRAMERDRNHQKARALDEVVLQERVQVWVDWMHEKRQQQQQQQQQAQLKDDRTLSFDGFEFAAALPGSQSSVSESNSSQIPTTAEILNSFGIELSSPRQDSQVHNASYHVQRTSADLQKCGTAYFDNINPGQIAVSENLFPSVESEGGCQRNFSICTSDSSRSTQKNNGLTFTIAQETDNNNQSTIAVRPPFNASLPVCSDSSSGTNDFLQMQHHGEVAQPQMFRPIAPAPASFSQRHNGQQSRNGAKFVSNQNAAGTLNVRITENSQGEELAMRNNQNGSSNNQYDESESGDTTISECSQDTPSLSAPVRKASTDSDYAASEFTFGAGNPSSSFPRQESVFSFSSPLKPPKESALRTTLTH